jgi:hypothetical protein
MLANFQKYTLTIPIMLLVTLLVALLIYPASSQALATIVLVFGIGTAIAFTINSNLEKHKKAELTRSEFIRNTFLDLLGLALTMGAAMWLGRLAGGYAGQSVSIKVGQGWGMAAGIAAGMVVGFGAAFLVGKIWGKISSRLQATQPSLF